MCDYCSCRSMPVIADLGADHAHLDALSYEVRRRITHDDEAGARVVFAELVGCLRDHMEVEEASVFAALRAEGELEEPVVALLHEHAAVWRAIAAPDHAHHDWRDAAQRILDDLHEHITREEYDLFPATLVALGAAGWAVAERGAERAAPSRRSAVIEPARSHAV